MKRISATVYAAALVCSTAFLPEFVTPAHAATCDASQLHAFSSGHQDMLLRGSGSSMTFGVHDDETERDYDEGQFYVEVPSNSARINNEYSSLPTKVWLIPQTQEPTIPWLGFNTSYLTEEEARDAKLSVELLDAPEGGRVIGYQAKLGAEPEVRFDSDDPSITWDYPDHFHSHTAIAFTQPGTYAVRFTFTLNDGSSHSLQVPFQVAQGDTEKLCSLNWSGKSQMPVEASGAGDLADVPGALDKGLKELEKTVSKLDKAINGSEHSVVSNTSSEAPKKSKSLLVQTQAGSKPFELNRPTALEATREAAPLNASAATLASNGSSAIPEGRNTAKFARPIHSPAQSVPLAAPQPPAPSPATESSSSGAALQSVSYNQPLYGFWAGVLAGMGVLSFLIGAGLFIWVQFFRAKNA